MNTLENSSKERSRQEMAAELLELGEMLFDTAIDMAAQRPAEEETGDATSIEEMRAAADEFFTALRLLLETGWEKGSSA
jgi:cob(I)alamin adenosyltransferase